MPSCNTAAKVQAAAAMGMLKRGREEPPHVRGQGQKLGGSHARRAAAKRSYPTSEVRGSGHEYQTARAQERLRGATPRRRSGGAAEKRYPASKVGGATREVTPRRRSGAAGGRSYPILLRPRPRTAAGRSNPVLEARGGGRED